MRGIRSASLIVALLMAGDWLLAQHATLEISEATLNAVIARLGTPSASGAYTPRPVAGANSRFFNCETVAIFLECPSGRQILRRPLLRCEFTPASTANSRTRAPGRVLVPAAGPSITWDWWVENPRFTLAAGSMTLSATVRSRVGAANGSTTASAPASLVFDAAANRIRVQVGSFSVPLTANGQTVTTVDVAHLYEIALPVEPQNLAVTLPNGSPRSLNLRATSISPQYLAGRVLVNINVGF